MVEGHKKEFSRRKKSGGPLCYTTLRFETLGKFQALFEPQFS